MPGRASTRTACNSLMIMFLFNEYGVNGEQRKTYLVIAPASDVLSLLIFSTSTEGQIAIVHLKCPLHLWYLKDGIDTHFVQPWLAAHAWNALSTTSTSLWLVKTLPAHTAAVFEGASKLFSGILTIFNLSVLYVLSTKSRRLD